jgi:HK97 family phage prohead protease
MSDILTVTFDSDLIIRTEAEGGDGRTVSGIVVPWNVPIPTSRDGRIATGVDRRGAFESFRRGSLTKSLNEAKKAVPLYADHDRSRPVGTLLRSSEGDRGQAADFRIVKTQAGDEALELIREGIWTGFSLGYRPVDARTVQGTYDGLPLFERTEVKIDHVAVLHSHAYEDARVLAVRSEEEEAEYRASEIAAAKQRIRSRY